MSAGRTHRFAAVTVALALLFVPEIARSQQVNQQRHTPRLATVAVPSSRDGEALSCNSCGRRYRAIQSDRGGYIRILNRRSEHILTLPHRGPLRREMFSHTETAIVTVKSDGSCWLYDLPSGKRRFCLANKSVVVALFVPNGKGHVMICRPTLISFKDSDDNKLIGPRITSPRSTSFAEAILTVEPDTSRLFTLDTKGTTRVWDLTDTAISGKPVRMASHQLRD